MEPQASRLDSFPEFRFKQLMTVSKPVGLTSVSIGCTAMLRTFQDAMSRRVGLLPALAEVMGICVYPTLLSLPFMCIHIKRLDLLQPVVVLSHVIRSLALLAVGVGLAPNSESIAALLRGRVEMVLEISLVFQDQVPLPIMSVLHALRSLGWMSIVAACMEGDPMHTLLRGVINWLIMMMVSCLFEAYAWTSYGRYCRRHKHQQSELQQQVQEKQERLRRQAEVMGYCSSPTCKLRASTDALDKAGLALDSDCRAGSSACGVEVECWACSCMAGSTPPDAIPMDAADGASSRSAYDRSAECRTAATASVTAPCQPQPRFWPLKHSVPSTTPARSTRSSTPTVTTDVAFPGNNSVLAHVLGKPLHGSGVQKPAAIRTDCAGALYAGSATKGAGTPVEDGCSEAGAASAVETADADTAVVRVASPVHKSLLASDSTHSQPLQSAREIMRVVEQQRKTVVTYKRSKRLAVGPVNVKIQGVDPDHLPPDMPSIMQKQLQQHVSGVVMTSIAFRSGCVVMTLDLVSLVPGTDVANRRITSPTGSAGGCAQSDGLEMLAGGLMEAVTGLVRENHNLECRLVTGTSMWIQTPKEVRLCKWDAATATYTKTVDNIWDSDSAVQGWSATCGLVRISPAVMALPSTHVGHTKGSLGSTMIKLVVELQLPGSCSLYVWPDLGSTDPADVDATIRWPYPVGWTDASGPCTMMIARMVGGGYLPMVLGAIGSDSVETNGPQKVVAEVTISVPSDSAPTTISLELWYRTSPAQQASTTPLTSYTTNNTPDSKTALAPEGSNLTPFIDPARSLELLVSHIPMLVLPRHCSLAAEELQAHLDELGGVQPYSAWDAVKKAAYNSMVESVVSNSTLASPLTVHMQQATPVNVPSIRSTVISAPASVKEGMGLTSSSISTPLTATADMALASQPGQTYELDTIPSIILTNGCGSRLAEDTRTAFAAPGNDLLSCNSCDGSVFSDMMLELSDPATATNVVPAPAIPVNSDVEADDSGSSDLSRTVPNCMLEDLGAWLSHHYRMQEASFTTAGLAPAKSVGDSAEAQVMEGVGMDLLVHALRYGLSKVASLMAETMEATENLQRAEIGPSKWFVTVASQGSASESAAMTTAFEPREHAHERAPTDESGQVQVDGVGLLHATVASGQLEILEMVLSWGKLYGGANWSWAELWAVEDTAGVTPLHLMAALPTATCTAMLSTINIMLRPPEAQAARHAWMHVQGHVGATPAAVFALASNMIQSGDVKDMMLDGWPASNSSMRKAWGPTLNMRALVQADSMEGSSRLASGRDPNLHETVEEVQAIMDCDMLCYGCAGTNYDQRGVHRAKQGSNLHDMAGTPPNVSATPSKANASSHADILLANTHLVGGDAVFNSSAPATMCTPSMPANSSAEGRAKAKSVLRGWLRSVMEVWIMIDTPEYRNWTQTQKASLVQSWAATLVFVWVTSLTRAAVAGCLAHEILHISLHNALYLPVAAAISGASWLGDSQIWMFAANLSHALAFAVVSYKKPHEAIVWAGTAGNWGDVVYCVIVVATGDQTPLRQLAIAQLLQSYFHGVAYRAVSVPHPFLRSFLVHLGALAIATVSRVAQLHAYRTWQKARSVDSAPATKSMYAIASDKAAKTGSETAVTDGNLHRRVIGKAVRGAPGSEICAIE